MSPPNMKLRADFRFTIYDLDNGRARIVLTGAQSGRQFQRDASSAITILVWFDMLRLYLKASSQSHLLEE